MMSWTMKPLRFIITILYLTINLSFAQTVTELLYANEQRNDPAYITIPSGYAEIRERYEGSSDFTVIHIQDAHCIYEAQKNIATILDYLQRSYGVNLIALEGADDVLVTDEFSSFPQKQIRQDVSDYMMKNGRISGAEYFDIVSDSHEKLTGLENRALYTKNLSQYKQMLTHRARIEQVFARLERILSAAEEQYYTPEMKRLIEMTEDYQAGIQQLTDYVQNLLTLCSRHNISLDQYPNLLSINTIHSIEKDLDFETIHRQRRLLIDDLCEKMDAEALRTFLRAHMDFKLMQRSHEDFHSYLKSLMTTYNVSSSNYPDLQRYFSYLELYNNLDWADVNKETAAITEQLLEVLSTNEIQQQVYACRESLKLMHELYLMYLPVYRYEEYLQQKEELQPSNIIGQLTTLLPQTTLGEEQLFLTQTLPLVEQFYTVAQERDISLFDNLLTQVKEHNSHAVAFIAGGFHTKGITNQLRGNDISYIVVVPKVTHVPESNEYLSMIMEQKNVYELYLGKSTLAIATWLEKNPLVAEERKISVGYRMKSLMVAEYTYTVSQEAPQKVKTEADFLTNKITTLLNEWGEKNYGDLKVTDIRPIGPYLQIAMVVNGKEVIFLFTTSDEGGKATLDTPHDTTMDILFNGAGELNLLESDMMNGLRFQIITPQGLKALLACGNKLNSRSTQKLRESIRTDMENRLTVLMIENQVEGPEQFQELLKANNIGLSKNEMSNFFEKIGVYFMHDIFHPAFSASIANSTLLGTYLGIKAYDTGLYISDNELPAKVSHMFNRLGFDSMYIEQGIPIYIIRDFFRKLSSDDITITPAVSELYLGSDENNSYYVSVVKQGDGRIFLKLEQSNTNNDDFTHRIDPAILDMIITPATYPAQEENLLPIAQYEPGITFIEVQDNKMVINLLKVDKNLSFQQTDIKLSIDLGKKLPSLESFFTQIKTAASENGIQLLGIVMNNPELTGDKTFFHDFESFMQAYYSFIVGVEVNKRLTKQYHESITMRLVSNNIAGQDDKLTYSNILFKHHGVPEFALITEKIVPSSEGYRFNIGLGEFLQDRFENLKPYPVKFEPVSKLIIRHNSIPYTLGKGSAPGDIRLLLRDNQYSARLSDGEIEFISQAIRSYDTSLIEHLDAKLPPASAFHRREPLFIDQWTKHHYTGDSKKLYDFLSQITPFFADKVLSYQNHLNNAFGEDITVLDLFGFQGSLLQQILRKSKESHLNINVSPYAITNNIFDSSISKELLKKYNLNADRVSNATLFYDEGNTIAENIALLQAKKQHSTPIVPHVVTLVGKTLEYGVISHNDAVNMISEIYDILPDGGFFFIGGTDFLAVQEQDFLNTGFEIIEMGNPSNFFDESILPKQYYILRKPIDKSSNLLPSLTSTSQQELILTEQPAKETSIQMQPVEDAFDFIVQLNSANISMVSPHDNKTYGLQLLPKLKIQRPDGGVQLVSDISPEMMELSVDENVYYEVFLVSDDTKSLLPVMEGTMSIGLQEFSVNRIMLDSVNFQGLLKDLHDIEFTYTIARTLSQILPQNTMLSINSDLSHAMILALYQTLPEPQNEKLFRQMQALTAKITHLRKQHMSIEDLLPKYYDGTAALRKELQEAMADPETLQKMNTNMEVLANVIPVRSFIDAGFSRIQLRQGQSNQINLIAQKRQPIPVIIASGSLRHGIVNMNGPISSPNNIDDVIREKLLKTQETLVTQHKVTDEYYRSVNFNIVQGAKTDQKLQADSNTIVLNYDLFRDIDDNDDMLVMEIQQGLLRLQIQNLSKQDAISPIDQGILELYLLLNKIQTFIDLRLADNGIKRQQNILHFMERDMDMEDRLLLQLFQYIFNHEIKSAWAVRDTALKFITATGEFEGTNIYPEDIRNKLVEDSLPRISDEIDRINQLLEYTFIKDVVTKSRTSKFSLNIHSHKEKSINELVNGNDLQLAYIKIQNFKDVFNTFGAQLDLGHYLGDIGIYVISRQLKESLEEKLAPHGVTVYIGNAGGEFFVSFANVGDLDIAPIMHDILVNPESSLKKNIISEMELAVIDFVGKEKFEAIADAFRHGFTEDKINFYAGLSEKGIPKKADPEADSGSRRIRIARYAALTTDRLYLQAFQAAKHQQLQFNAQYNSTREQAQQYQSSGKADQADLARMFDPIVKAAGKEPKSGLMTYTPEIQAEINENNKIGLLTEYQLFHRAIAPTYQHYTSIESLSKRLLDAIENRADEEIIGELKDRIVETALRYKSPNLSNSEYIYEGNENFKRIINFCISSTPDYDIALTFRLGGDEYGKLVWDSQTKILHIYRFDGNNVGATTFEWGIDIGDKLIDESLRIIANTDDMSKLQNNITAFFDDMNSHGIELTEEQLQDIRQKVPTLLVFDEPNYRLLKQNGTLADFTKENAAVVVRTEDGKLLMTKFPDIHVPYTLQKDSISFNYMELAPDPQFETAIPVTFLIGDTAIDFTISKDKDTGDIIISSSDKRAPERVAISLKEVKLGTKITIPIQDAKPLSFSFAMGYRNMISITGDILSLRENEFQRVKLAGYKLIEKDGKLSAMVTSRPVVSTGYIEIDTKKIDPKYRSKDISVIQGRADTASEIAKERTKLYQILHNGAVRIDKTLYESPNEFTGAPNEMTSFDTIEFSFWDTLVSRYIIEGSKEKLNRRIDYFSANENNMKADDIFVLAQMFLSHPDLLDDYQKNMLLYRIMSSYQTYSNYETNFMATNTLRDILTSEKRGVWESGISVFLGLLPQKEDASQDKLFFKTINLIAAEPPNHKLTTQWHQHQPKNFYDWIKAIMDMRQIDILETLHTMSFDQIDEYAHTLDRFLPLAQQYIESFNAGKIVESQIRNNPAHDIILNIFSFHDEETLKNAYEFAQTMVAESLLQSMDWGNISSEERSLFISIFTGSRILEDSVEKIFGQKIQLGDIQTIRIDQGKKSNLQDEYLITVEMADGTTLVPMAFSFLPNLMAINPPELRKFFTPEAIDQYIEHGNILSEADPKLFSKPGDHYEISVPSGMLYHIVTTKKISSETSETLINEIGKNFRDRKVEEETNAIVTKDIMAYLQTWDVLGRELFFQSPSPKFISKGSDIRCLQYLESGLSNADIITRLYTSYIDHTSANVIFDAIIDFFVTYDPKSTSAGYQFLTSAFNQLRNKDVQGDLFSYLDSYLTYLEKEIQSHIDIPYELFLANIRISRTITHYPSESSFFSDALALLEEKVSFDQKITLNYPTYRFIVDSITTRHYLPVHEQALLENDVMAFFKHCGYNPEKELQQMLSQLSSLPADKLNDMAEKELIDHIEALEVVLGLKNPDQFSSINQRGTTYSIHPYSNPIEIPVSHPGSMPPREAVRFLDEKLNKHFAEHDRPCLMSFAGRAAAGKIEALQAIFKNSSIIDESDVGIIKTDSLLNKEGNFDLNLLHTEMQQLKDKELIIFYGRNILLTPQILSAIEFDYNIFIESDDTTTMKRLMQTGNTRLLNRFLIDNIVNHWGVSLGEEQLPLQPHGIDSQRTQADLIINMSASESIALLQPRVLEPVTIAGILCPEPDIREKMAQYLDLIKQAFNGDTAGKQLILFEPQNPVVVVGLAMLGFNTTVASTKLKDIPLSLSNQYRIKATRGSISYTDTYGLESFDLQQPNLYDLIIVNNMPRFFDLQKSTHAQTPLQSSQTLIKSLRYNGLILISPTPSTDMVIRTSQKLGVTMTDITESISQQEMPPQTIDGNPLAILQKNIPSGQLANLNMPVDAPLVNAINQSMLDQTPPPTVVAIDFDDIFEHLSQWDAYVLSTALKKRQEYYTKEDVPVQFAFVSTQKSSQQIRTFLGLTNRSDSLSFLFLGNEDLTEIDVAPDTDRNAVFTKVPELLSQFSHFFNPNVILLESNSQRANHAISANAIVLDISDFIAGGLFVDELLHIQSLLEATLLSNKIDQTLLVSSASEHNPLRDRVITAEASGTKHNLQDLLEQRSVSFQDLRGLVIVPSSEQRKPQKIRQKISNMAPIEQSL